MKKELHLSEYTFKTYTLIYLLKDGKILLLHRDKAKSDMANKLTGLGGKIEKGELLFESAKRECLEESGLTMGNPKLRGTFQWFDESSKICMTHIIFATDFSGELKRHNREGFLAWYLLSELENLLNLANYQRMFLSYLLEDENNFYSGIGVFKDEELVDYVDTTGRKYE
ncbi:MAG TPA: NUDIX domain-containing protein [Flavobacterium sp.]|uniref:NUDIX domain-containing protein n=1 Tax=Flavobacterium sp. TaxID=239 RepID=UPI002ED2C2D4